MRTLPLLAALATALFVVAPTAAASPAVPTCLIGNAGAGGHFGKTLLCVELVDQGIGHAGSGSYAPGDTTPHWLTETVEFRALGRTWLPLATATATAHGTGALKAVTRTVLLPGPGALRACTRVGTAPDAQTTELCSTPN